MKTKIYFLIISIWLILLVVTYFVGVFISFEWNPQEWWISGRVCLLITVVVISTKAIDELNSAISLIKSKEDGKEEV